MSTTKTILLGGYGWFSGIPEGGRAAPGGRHAGHVPVQQDGVPAGRLRTQAWPASRLSARADPAAVRSKAAACAA